MRNFTLGELWGHIHCEHEGCLNEAWTIQLTEMENRELPEPSGPEAVTYIFEHRLGKALCDEHLEGEER